MSPQALPRRYLASLLLVVTVHAVVLSQLLQRPPLQRVAPPEVVLVDLGLARPGSPAAAVAAPAPASLPGPASPPVEAPPVPPARVPAPAALAPAPLAAPPVEAAAAAVLPATAAGQVAAPSPDAAAAAALAPEASADTPPGFTPGGASTPRPPYPDLSRSLGETGNVDLLMRVEADGHVSDVRMVRSSGHRRLDQSALRTVRGWVLRPARQGGVPVAAWMPYTIEFKLEE